MITEEQFKQILPKSFKGTVTQDVMDYINNSISDPILAEAFQENVLSYTKVIADGRFKIQDYLNAVKYVSLKLCKHSNVDAYLKTFPDKHQQFITNNTSSKDISSYVSMYNGNKLVSLIFAQTLNPHWILNQHMYQEALNTQVEIMKDEKINARDRAYAANSVLLHLKPPETNTLEITVGLKSDSAIETLRQSMLEFSAFQRSNIINGISTPIEVAQSKLIIDGEFTDV